MPASSPIARAPSGAKVKLIGTVSRSEGLVETSRGVSPSTCHRLKPLPSWVMQANIVPSALNEDELGHPSRRSTSDQPCSSARYSR